MEETKRQKFVRLAENRTNRILDTLELLSNLSNTSNYEYNQKDVERIFKAIENSVAETKKSFSRNSEQKHVKFTLED